MHALVIVVCGSLVGLGFWLFDWNQDRKRRRANRQHVLRIMEQEDRELRRLEKRGNR